jgi:lipopolysaccharide export LptBFGC system permease protein LptF
VNTLDRHLVSLGLGRWGLVLFLGTFLILFCDFIGGVGGYLAALGSSRWWLFLLFELVRLPGFLLLWLPLATLVAAMLTAAPLIGQGTLTALCSAGVPLSRIFRVFVALAVFSVGVSFVLNDQTVTRLSSFVDRVNLAMEGKSTLHADRARAVGWRTADAVWSAADALPATGVFGHVAAFRSDRSRCMLTAQQLTWHEGAWQLTQVVVVEGEQRRELASATPAEVGFALTQDLPTLANALRADDSRSSDELFAAGASRRWQILCGRIAVALLPLLCLLYGLPRFLVWNDRTRLAVVGFQAALWALIPIAAIGLLGRLLVSAGAQPVFLALGILGAVFAFGVLRWRRMRL